MNTFFNVLKVVIVDMANFEKEFQKIEGFKQLIHQDVLGGRFDRVQAGVIRDESNNPFDLVLDHYAFPVRVLWDPSERRVFKWTKDWVVSLEQDAPEDLANQGIKRVYTPIAYRADLADLPVGTLEPILGRIDQIQTQWNNDRSLLIVHRKRS